MLNRRILFVNLVQHNPIALSDFSLLTKHRECFLKLVDQSCSSKLYTNMHFTCELYSTYFHHCLKNLTLASD